MLVIAPIIFAVIVLILVLIATKEGCIPSFLSSKKKWNTRSKRLADYPDLYGISGLINPSVDGFLDWEWIHSVERKSWKKERFGDQTQTARLSQALEKQINARYYAKGTRNAHIRATRFLRDHEKQRYYFLMNTLDIGDICNKAIETQSVTCAECFDRWTVWGPYKSGLETENPCECGQKPKRWDDE